MAGECSLDRKRRTDFPWKNPSSIISSIFILQPGRARLVSALGSTGLAAGTSPEQARVTHRMLAYRRKLTRT
jgi:hypothetical protein